MMAWLINKLFKRFMVQNHPIMFVNYYGPSWYLVDHFGRLWKLKYTGDRVLPIVIEKVNE